MMNAQDLARWTRFAGKGGIGRCTAIIDCVAEEMGEDLMFLKDDQITVLMQLPEEGFYLGHCEGVVGRFSAKDVRFHGKLKRPVKTKRTSVTSGTERISIAVVERSASVNKDRDGVTRTDGQWDRRILDRPGSREKWSPSPTQSEKSLARSFASFKDKEEGEWKDGRHGRHSKALDMASSVSGSSVYSLRSARSVSTATSLSSYSTASSASSSAISDATETEHTGFETSSSFHSPSSVPSDGLAASSSGTSITLSATNGSIGTDSSDPRTSLDIDLYAGVEEIPSFGLSAAALGLGTAATTSNLPPVAPLRLSKSPRHTPTSLPFSSSPTPSTGNPLSLSSGPSSPLTSLPSSLSPGSSRALSPGNPAPSPGLSGSLSPGLSVSLSPDLPGSHSPSPRSPVFLSRSQVYKSSGTSTSSPHLPNPYGRSLPSPYASISGGYSGLNLPPSAPPTGPLPPAPQSDQACWSADREELDTRDDSEEAEEGNSTRLSTLDAFRRRLREEDEVETEDLCASTNLDDDEHDGWLGSLRSRPEATQEHEGDKTVELTIQDTMVRGQFRPHANGHGEDGNSDGEIGIGLSLMSALDDDGSDDDVPLTSIHAVDKPSGSAPSLHGQLPNDISQFSFPPPPAGSSGSVTHGHDSHPEPEDAGGDGREEEDDDEGGYWDDIYDDYRYSRYSLASKRFSIASRRMSVISKASAGSKTSGTSKSSRAPPVPVPTFSPDHPNVSVERPSLSTDPPCFERPSFGSDRPSEESEQDFRPSLESTSPTASAVGSPVSQSPNQTFSPSLDLSLSDDARSSSYSTQTLDRLSSQFPAVPTGVPVRVESRLRIVNDGHVEPGSDVHREKEMEVMHESTIDDTPEEKGGEVVAKQTLLTGDKGHQDGILSANMLTSSLLHSIFTSPHSPRLHMDTEVGSEHGHGLDSQRREKLHESRDSADDDDLLVGGLKSPFETEKESIEGGTLVSALGTRIECEHGRTSPTTTAPSNSTSDVGSGSKAMASDDANRARTGEDGSFSPSSADMSQTITAPPSTSNTPKPLLPVPEQQPQNLPAHPFSRSSIFLPHPNAPKPTGHQGLGPMYARPLGVQSHATGLPSTGPGSVPYPAPPPNSSPFAASVLYRLRDASLARGPGPGAPARRPPMTLFARCQPDLGTSTGPVPIIFSLEPLPPLARSPHGPSSQIQTPTAVMFPMRSATLPPPLRKGSLATNISALPGGGVYATDSAVLGGEKEQKFSTSDVLSLRLPRRSVTSPIGPLDPAKESTQAAVTAVASPALPIARPGFIPQVSGARPRSRSFSAFGAKIAETMERERSYEEPASISSMSARSRPGDGLSGTLRSKPILSPLMLRGNTLSGNVAPRQSVVNSMLPPSSPLPKSATSPVSQSPATSTFQSTLQPPANNEQILIRPATTSPAPLPSPIQGENDVSAPTGRITALSNSRSVTSPQSCMQTRCSSTDAPQTSSIDSHLPRQSSDSDDSHSVMQSPPLPDGIHTTRSSPLSHEAPLRTKLSLPALRGKMSARPRLEDTASIASSQVGFGGSTENETVQVQDMDFELVKPSIPHVTGRPSQDSTLGGHEPHVEPTSPGLFTDTASVHSSAPRSPLVANEQTASITMDSQVAADAHRQREVRWMALLPTVTPSQARKNKKVKRLLQDGVPSSLRYLVWCHLTDSKARALPGVYAKLGKRLRVPVFDDIEKDATKCFPDQPQLHNALGPLVSLLQAYLSMVPDIQYNAALASIAGHLLLLAPEEDAFWIFTSMMDAHLRPYFSPSTIQMEVDAALLSKAIETNDTVLHKKVYITLQMNPTDITRPWFSSLFVGTLPVDYLHRIWDIFLYEGMTFLFRVGLAILHCVRHLLLQATTADAILDHLARPPIACLPSSPDDFVSLSFNMKLKDEDVRKQRIKMEAQVKRQTQARTHPTNSLPSRQTTSISLPRP